MNGCKFCPAHNKCSVTYRGSACAAIRYYYGLEHDPEIVTNADRIRAMSDEELSVFLWEFELEDVSTEVTTEGKWIVRRQLDSWLKQPVEEEK